MAKRSTLTNRTPSPEEIGDVASAVRARDLARLVLFADMITRYVSIRQRHEVKWLQITALTHITTRGGSLTASQLARLMLRSSYSMTRVIDDLEKDGLVVRERKGKDRRTIDVRVTSTGLSFLTKSLADIDLLEEDLLSCLHPDDLDALRNVVRVLRLTLIEKTGGPDAWVYHSRGVAYQALGRTDRAMADFEASARLSQDRPLGPPAKDVLAGISVDDALAAPQPR